MAGWRRLNGLIVGRKVAVRKLRHRRARINFKRQRRKDNVERQLDEEIANQKQEEGDSQSQNVDVMMIPGDMDSSTQQSAAQHPLDDLDFEASLEELIDDGSVWTQYQECCYGNPSLADGYTHMREPEERQVMTEGSPPDSSKSGCQTQLNPQPLFGTALRRIRIRDGISLADGYSHPYNPRPKEGQGESGASMAPSSRISSDGLSDQFRNHNSKEPAKRPEEAVELNQEEGKGDWSKDSPSHHQQHGIRIRSRRHSAAPQILENPKPPDSYPLAWDSGGLSQLRINNLKKNEAQPGPGPKWDYSHSHDEKKLSWADPSLADGCTRLSKTWLEPQPSQGTMSTLPMATTRYKKFKVLLWLVAALVFVISGCIVLCFSSSEVNGSEHYSLQ